MVGRADPLSGAWGKRRLRFPKSGQIPNLGLSNSSFLCCKRKRWGQGCPVTDCHLASSSSKPQQVWAAAGWGGPGGKPQDRSGGHQIHRPKSPTLGAQIVNKQKGSICLHASKPNKTQTGALAGVAQWIEYQPTNQRVSGSIPNQGMCLGYGPGPLQGAHERQPHTDVSLPLSPALPLCLKINKIFNKPAHKQQRE